MHEVGKKSTEKVAYVNASDAHAFFLAHPTSVTDLHAEVKEKNWSTTQPLPGYEGTGHYKTHKDLASDFEVYPTSHCKTDATEPMKVRPGAPKPKSKQHHSTKKKTAEKKGAPS